MLGYDLGDLRERSWLVDRLKHDPRREALRCALLHVPTEIQPTLGHVLEIPQGRRLDWVYGDSLPRSENADDTITRHRAAIGREAHG